MENSNIFFQGDNNILFIEDGVVLNNARIHFNGSNSLIYLRKSRHKIKVNLQIGQDSLLFVGKDNYFNDTLHISATEWQSVIVGNNCLFSFGIWLRTADPHLVYSTETNQRINHSKPILIGDHVWIGQDSLILKGTQIGSGSIVGGHSVVAGKKLPSNTIYGGNPAKQIRGGAFWLDSCTHTWTEERSKEWNCPPPPRTQVCRKRTSGRTRRRRTRWTCRSCSVLSGSRRGPPPGWRGCRRPWSITRRRTDFTLRPRAPPKRAVSGTGGMTYRA